MARVSTYLNFARETEAAFTFYKSVFGTEFIDGISRMADVPSQPGRPELSEADKQLVMHVELPILGGHHLMGTDAPESLGFRVSPGNNVYIMLEPDSPADVDSLFAALSAGGRAEMEPQEMFWGDYYASLEDKFGVHWMLNAAKR